MTTTPGHSPVRRAFRRTRCTCGLRWPCPDRNQQNLPLPDGDSVPHPGGR
ncbi:hypothetical protein [Winogradskya humida]